MPKQPQWVKNALEIQDMQDQHAAMSRLAAGDVVGLKDREGNLEPGGDLFEVRDRWERVRFTYLPDENPGERRLRRETRDMVSFLEEARVTINFNAANYFQDGIPDTYSNIWQRETGKAAHHKINREIVEPELGRYGSARPADFPGPDLDDDDDYFDNRWTTETVRNRIDTYLSQNSALFAPASRPRYGALDYQECRHGGAVTLPYGASFLVLREHVKHRATFTPKDSFGYFESARRGERVGAVYADGEAAPHLLARDTFQHLRIQ